MSELGDCGNCGAELRDTTFKRNLPLRPNVVSAINEIYGLETGAFCDKCGDAFLKEAGARCDSRLMAAKREMLGLLSHVPLCSIHQPAGWDYVVCGLVTAQSVTGTGMFSDIASAFTDLFGAQSKTYNNKIREGENICRASLCLQAVDLGAEALIGVDVDYAEVGGQRAMLMVCMTGTAVKFREPPMDLEGSIEFVATARALSTQITKLEQAKLSLAY